MNWSSLYLAISFLTGASALIYQVLWQHLTGLLLGADARASTLVVAVFLLGLSIGYYVFGTLSQKIQSRKQFLKIYGIVEILISLYSFFFIYYFELFFFSDAKFISTFGGQILISLLLYLPPTIGMGATVPVLTSVLPTDPDSINRLHTKIYGLNTLGALLGVSLATFFILPTMGVKFGLQITAIANIFFVLPYIFNNLNGEIKKIEVSSESLSVGRLSPWVYYLISFFSGLILLALEIIWFRIWGLTIGTSYIIFPMVVGLFVGVLGISGLNLKKYSDDELVRSLTYAMIFLVFSFFLVPHIPLWTSNIRLLLTSHLWNFPVYYSVCFLVMLGLLGPTVYFGGRVLPLSYSLTPKSGNNFGKICSLIYFANTAGTFIGAVFVGHWLKDYFGVEGIYRLLILLYVGILILLLVLHGLKFGYSKSDEKIKLILVLMIVGISGWVTSQKWNRIYHITGTFRDRILKPYSFKSLVVRHKIDSIFLKDGANTTVAVTKTFGEKDLSIYVNGKSDSNIMGDYSTLNLLAILPYLKVSKEKNLKSLNIGFGTGLTTGISGKLKDVDHVDVVEISPTVIDASVHFRSQNHDPLQNSKVHLHVEDAFRFLRRTQNTYDIIISEPTNPWVSGVENLYTNYFYDQVLKKISSSGVFVQWMHFYAMDEVIFGTVIHNLQSHFRNIQVYITHAGDIAMIASNNILKGKNFISRSQEPIVQEALARMNLPSVDSIDAFQIFTEVESSYLANNLPRLEHDIYSPKLSRHALQTFFLDGFLEYYKLIDPFLVRSLPKHPRLTEYREQLLKSIKEKYKEFTDCSVDRMARHGIYYNLPCLLLPQMTHYEEWMYGKDPAKKLTAYASLRSEKYLNRTNLLILYQEILNWPNENERRNLILALIQESIKDGQFPQMAEKFPEMVQRGLLVMNQVEHWRRKASHYASLQKKIADEYAVEQ